MTQYTPSLITPGIASDANADVNNELTAIANILNGGIDAGNLAALAVTLAKMAANSVDSSKIVDGAIVDADVNAAAALAVSKLLQGSNGSVLKSAAGAASWSSVGSNGALLYNTGTDLAWTDAPADGEMLRAVGTVPTWVDPEVAYVEFTSPVTVTGTSEGAATAVVSAGAADYDAVPHLIEFFSPRIQAPTSVGMFVVLYDGTTPLGQLAVLNAASPRTMVGGTFPIPLTPTAASHTYNVKAWVGSSSGTVDGGAGGTGAQVPGFIRITRV